MDVSIIIPNYNGAYLLEKNLPKVIKTIERESNAQLQKSSKVIEIIVVDDGSADTSVSEIKKQKSRLRQDYGGQAKFKNLRLIRHKRNLGFASTVNTGVKNAKGDIVILLNTDVVPEKGFLPPLLSHFTEREVFAVGCLDKSIEDGRVVKRGRGVAWWTRGFLVHRRGEVNKTDTFWVSGGSAAFRKSTWDKLGGMDELYNPFYWEDIDLSYRAVKSGFKILFEPKSVVVHKHEKGAIKSRFSPFYTRIIVYRNQFYFVWKNILDTKLIFSHILWLPYYFIRSLLALDCAFYLGFFLALINIRKTAVERSKLKQQSVINDNELLFL
jgi:GT2 family glycosyltransferase